MQTEFDIIIIGAGIAGASVAAHLAPHAKVLMLEMEDRPGFHTTGRSAASYEPNYGPPPMLAFTRASAAFFKSPPEGFADGPLLTPRPSLFLEAEGQAEFTAKLLAHSADLEEISEARATEFFPILKHGYAKRSFLDVHTGDLDVDLLHRGYLRLFKAAGGTLATSELAKTIVRQNLIWNIITPHAQFFAPIIVNAAGAWGDEIAKSAGVKPIGLTPKRRSIGVVPVNGYPNFANWPMVTDTAETWYAKPQSGKLIVSSADATPVEPHDAYADDMAIAEGIDRLMNATSIEVTQLDHAWGGLRTFAPDGNPVIGFDPYTDGFFWLVGQGGYGIQSAPALSRAAAALVLGNSIPDDIVAEDLNIKHIHPDRVR
jgi:D-arginine dehydrogenase